MTRVRPFRFRRISTIRTQTGLPLEDHGFEVMGHCPVLLRLS